MPGSDLLTGGKKKKSAFWVMFQGSYKHVVITDSFFLCCCFIVCSACGSFVLAQDNMFLLLDPSFLPQILTVGINFFQV